MVKCEEEAKKQQREPIIMEMNPIEDSLKARIEKVIDNVWVRSETEAITCKLRLIF